MAGKKTSSVKTGGELRTVRVSHSRNREGEKDMKRAFKRVMNSVKKTTRAAHPLKFSYTTIHSSYFCLTIMFLLWNFSKSFIIQLPRTLPPLFSVLSKMFEMSVIYFSPSSHRFVQLQCSLLNSNSSSEVHTVWLWLGFPTFFRVKIDR